MLRQAKRVGRRFVNPVLTQVGEWSTIFKVLPLYLSNKEEKVPRKPLVDRPDVRDGKLRQRLA